MAVPGQGFMCKICRYVCKLRSSLKRHIIGLHLNTETCLCPICGKTFNTMNNRQIHVRRAHGMTLTSNQLNEMEKNLKF